ncbi:hypothetical protein HYS72_00175 [Candidatus Pacearchaeota archaeon]|nr:hypothetical protein [Candidatus Pacearchaeota archaeon]
MKLEGIITEGNIEDIERIKKAIEKLPEDTIRNIDREKGKNYLKVTTDKKDDSIINLQCLEKKGFVYVPEKAEIIKYDLENEPGIFFFYMKTPYKILYPK